MKTWMFTAVVALFACESKPDVAKNEALVKLEAAGVQAEGLAQANGMIAGAECQQGKIDGIDAALCQFKDEAAAKGGEQTGLGWVGEAHAGAAVSSGRALLVLADRDQSDPTGKRIDEITKAFQK